MNKLILRKSFWIALGSIGILACWFGPWRYQTNDDVLMMWLVSGAYTGTPEAFAVFIHPSLSWLFSILYRWIPELNWYGMTWFFSIWLSFYALVDLVFLLKLPWKRIFQVLSIALVLSFHFCLFPQFTIVAGWAALAGGLGLLYSSQVKSVSLEIISFCLVFLALLIRWEAVGLVFLPLFLFHLFFDPQRILGQIVKGALISLLFFGVIFSKKLIEKSSEYSKYIEFNEARSSVLDHPIFYHLRREGKVPRASEWKYFSVWMIDDLAIGVDDLIDYRAELDTQRWTPEFIGKSFDILFTTLNADRFKSTFGLILILLFSLSGFPLRMKIGFGLFWLCFFLVMNFWFLLHGRVLILFLIPFLGFSISPIDRKEVELSFPVLLFLVPILFFVHLYNVFVLYVERKEIQTEYRLLTRETKSALFTENLHEFNLPMEYHSRNLVPTISYGWISKSPFQKKAIEVRGLKSFDSTEEYSLLNFKNQQIPIFPIYMRFLQPNTFELIDYEESKYFELFTFSKRH